MIILVIVVIIIIIDSYIILKTPPQPWQLARCQMNKKELLKVNGWSLKLLVLMVSYWF